MNEKGKAGAAACHGPLQHLQIAIRVAERGDGAAADPALDGDGLAFLVVDELDLGTLIRTGLPSRISNFNLPTLPITCSGGMPYTRSVHPRMNSTPPPDAMNVLNPLARRNASSSTIG